MQKLVKAGKNTEINKQSDVKFWLNWIKYGAVSYSLSCMYMSLENAKIEIKIKSCRSICFTAFSHKFGKIWTFVVRKRHGNVFHLTIQICYIKTSSENVKIKIKIKSCGSISFRAFTLKFKKYLSTFFRRNVFYLFRFATLK